MEPARRTLCVLLDGVAYRWRRRCLVEEAATSVIGRFVTTRERVMVSRPFAEPARFWVPLQGQAHNMCPAPRQHLKIFQLNSRTPRAGV